jgi:cytochrome b6-f complex iron-sulfur subunit
MDLQGQYDPEGAVVRGPAPLPLALALVAIEGERVLLSTWSESDPRTGEKPWWS